MKVLGKNVLVKRESGELTSTGGLILTSSLEPDYGRVLCIGADVNEVSVGELVFMDWNKANPVGSEQYVIDINDIVWVVE